MAEREGFEPSKRFPVYTLSKRAPSTTRPPLLFIIINSFHKIFNKFFVSREFIFHHFFLYFFIIFFNLIKSSKEIQIISFCNKNSFLSPITCLMSSKIITGLLLANASNKTIGWPSVNEGNIKIL